MATQSDTRIHAKQALTAQGWQEDVMLQIDKAGDIVTIESGVTRERDADHRVDVLLPAMANLHSHSFQRAMAGMAERRSAANEDDFWTWRSTMYRFLELLTPDDIEAIAALVQMEMLEAGYTACGEFHYIHHAPQGVRYDNPSETSLRHISAAQTTGIGLTHLPVLYTRGGLDQRPLEGGQLRFGCSLDEFASLHDKLSGEFQRAPKDFVLGLAPHSLRAVDADGLQLVQQLCTERPIHIHIAEQVREVDDVKKHLGTSPVNWLLDNCRVDHRWCLVHATHMSGKETAGLAKSGAVAGLCPITEANLGDGVFNASEYIAADGQFGIGSDSNVLISLTEELRLLEYSQRLTKRQRLVLTSAGTSSNGRFLYESAAAGGAVAVGRPSGSIEVGQLADLVALDTSHLALEGKRGDDLIDAWLFAARDSAIAEVWSAGRHAVTGGRHKQRNQIELAFRRTMKALQSRL